MQAEAPEEKSAAWQLPLTVIGSMALLVTAWFSVSYLVGPPVPRSLSIATGTSTGVYHRVAMKYRDALEEHGIELNILETNGSIDNLRLLQKGDATLAIVQGGTGTLEERTNLSSLASLYLEPVWIFYSKSSGHNLRRSSLSCRVDLIDRMWAWARGFLRVSDRGIYRITQGR